MPLTEFLLNSSGGEGFPGGTVGKNPPASVGDARDMGLISGLGRSSGEEIGNLLQYSCLENPVHRGAWRATVHGGLKELDTTEHAHTLAGETKIIISHSRLCYPRQETQWQLYNSGSIFTTISNDLPTFREKT